MSFCVQLFPNSRHGPHSGSFSRLQSVLIGREGGERSALTAKQSPPRPTSGPVSRGSSWGLPGRGVALPSDRIAQGLGNPVVRVGLHQILEDDCCPVGLAYLESEKGEGESGGRVLGVGLGLLPQGPILLFEVFGVPVKTADVEGRRRDAVAEGLTYHKFRHLDVAGGEVGDPEFQSQLDGGLIAVLVNGLLEVLGGNVVPTQTEEGRRGLLELLRIDQVDDPLHLRILSLLLEPVGGVVGRCCIVVGRVRIIGIVVGVPRPVEEEKPVAEKPVVEETMVEEVVVEVAVVVIVVQPEVQSMVEQPVMEETLMVKVLPGRPRA